MEDEMFVVVVNDERPSAQPQISEPIRVLTEMSSSTQHGGGASDAKG